MTERQRIDFDTPSTHIEFACSIREGTMVYNGNLQETGHLT